MFESPDPRALPHAIPSLDIRAHVIDAGGTCWCKPVDLGDMISHNAADRRERYEMCTARPH